eukprot:COSAG01_NODE_8738_length_2677_cov_3.877424_4_plen_328_part_00
MPPFLGQYSGSDEEQAAAWIGEVLGKPLGGTGGGENAASLAARLRSGVVLCELVNTLHPGVVPKVSTSSTPFAQRENIERFTAALRALGVPDRENFETSDLFEESNMRQVMLCLRSLGRAAWGMEGYEGACWGKADQSRITSTKPQAFEVASADGLWGKSGSQFSGTAGPVASATTAERVSSTGVEAVTTHADKNPPPRPPRRAGGGAAAAATAAAVSREQRAEKMQKSPPGRVMPDTDDPGALMAFTKNQIILPSLDGTGRTTFGALSVEADSYGCENLAAALRSLQQGDILHYEGDVLVMPASAAVMIRAGPAPQQPARVPAQSE